MKIAGFPRDARPVAQAPLKVAMRVDDPVLEARLRAEMTGVQIVGETDAADLVVTAALPVAPDAALTPREREVLALLAEGATNKTIARRLGISVHTAKFHVRGLTDKLDATGRTDAVAHAARTGVIRL